MPVQTTYEKNQMPAFEGQRANLGLINIISKVVEGKGIPFGRAVVRGTADNQVKLPSKSGQYFMGVTEMTTAWTENSDGVYLYEEFREANIIDFGMVCAYTEQAVVPGDSVYFRHTTKKSSDIAGRFRRDSDDKNADKVVGATWETTTPAGGVGQIKLRY